jgi:hypothetical protein
MLLEEIVEIALELFDSCRHVHMTNFSINSIRVGQCRGCVFMRPNRGLELVSTHLSHGNATL